MKNLKIIKMSILFLIVAFAINMINMAMFGVDASNVMDKLAIVDRFVENDLVGTANQISSLVNTGIDILKIIAIATLALQLIVLLVLNGINYLFAKKLMQKESLFMYVASIGLNIYLIYYILINLTIKQDLIQSLITLALIVNIVAILIYLLTIYKPAIKYLKNYFANFNYEKLAFDLLKVSALLIIVMASVIAITKLTTYLMIAQVIKSFDLASMINLSDYFSINIDQYIPEELQAYLPIMDSSLNVAMDQAFDTYILDNITTIIHNVLIRFEGTIVMKNFAIYVLSIVGSIVMVAMPTNVNKENNYIYMALSVIVAVFIFMYLTNIVLVIGATGLITSALLLGINEFK